MEKKLEQAFSADTFRRQGHELIDMLADYLEGATTDDADVKAIPWEKPEKQLEFWQEEFEQPSIPPIELFKKVMDRSVQVHRKRYIGHQTTPTLPVSILSSAVMATLNQGMGVYEMGMVGNTLEKVLVESMAEKLGFGEEASGFVTSGGSLGNLTALLAARAAVSGVWKTGYSEGQQFAVMVSEEAHYCIERAAAILGLGTEGVIKVPVNDRFQMRTDLLEEYYKNATAAGQQVICVVGCAGTTSTGSYDDLEAIAAFSREHGIWFHVDGAHGAPAAFSPRYRPLVKGIEQADSVVVDYHKMMMTPSIATALVFKRGGDAYKVFSQRAQYLWSEQTSQEWYNGGKRSFECTKPMTVLNVYTIYRTHGEQIFRENVERLYEMASVFADLVKNSPNLELAYEPESNIVCFRYSRPGSDLDELNKEIRRLLLEEGRFYIVQTILNRELYLRISVMNPLTGEKEFTELLQRIEEKASQVGI